MSSEENRVSEAGQKVIDRASKERRLESKTRSQKTKKLRGRVRFHD